MLAEPRDGLVHEHLGLVALRDVGGEGERLAPGASISSTRRFADGDSTR